MVLSRFLVLGLVLAGACLVIPDALGNKTASAPSSTTVTMVGHQFNPATVTIQVGDAVVWKNDSRQTHTATADDGSFDTRDVLPGKSTAHTFTKAGSFPYYCIYRGGPGGVGMSGKAVVNPATP